jgi:hypothetical protein
MLKRSKSARTSGMMCEGAMRKVVEVRGLRWNVKLEGFVDRGFRAKLDGGKRVSMD